MRAGCIKLADCDFVVSNNGTSFVLVANNKSQRLLASLEFSAPQTPDSDRKVKVHLPGLVEMNRRLVSLPHHKLTKESFYLKSEKNVSFGRTDNGSPLITITKCSKNQFDIWTFVELDPPRLFGIVLANHLALIPKRRIVQKRALKHLDMIESWKGLPAMPVSLTVSRDYR
jgi:hypothetical protein